METKPPPLFWNSYAGVNLGIKNHVFWPKIGSRIQEGCVSTHPFSKGRAWNQHLQSRKMCLVVFGSCESKESLFASICELVHPGLRCFSWNFLRVWEESRLTRRGRAKPLVTSDLNITFRQTRGSESDPWRGWLVNIFTNTQINLVGSNNLNLSSPWDQGRATTSCKSTWDTVPYFGINGLSMIFCLWWLHPLSKLLAIQDQAQNLEEQLWMGGRREVSIIFYRPVTRSDLKQERSFFLGSVPTFLQLVVAFLHFCWCN